MHINKKIKIFIEKLTGLYVYRTLPRGIEFFRDLSISLPEYKLEIVLDVGAHIGESAYLLLKKFPEARLFCFEPASANFIKLKTLVKGYKNVECLKIALGSEIKTGWISINGRHDMFHLIDELIVQDEKLNSVVEKVAITTIDNFCIENKIDKISYLKIDTEGEDLEVLKGATKSLSEQKIDFIQVEASMNPMNKHHIKFEVFKEFLESYNYFLFGFYEQMDEWIEKKINLRRTNSVFVSMKMIENYRGK